MMSEGDNGLPEYGEGNGGAKVLSFSEAREKREGPDAEFVVRDEMGVKWFTYGVRYRDGDAEFSFRIFARDFEDAERRLKLIASSGQVYGQIMTEVPASSA